MATRSLIGIEQENGTIEFVYCHYDGYLAGVGKTLLDHYSDPYTLSRLIENGDISVLGERIDPLVESHSFRYPEEGTTVFYHRDRGEEKQPKGLASSLQELCDMSGEHFGAEYVYVLCLDDTWFVYNRYSGEVLIEGKAEAAIEKEHRDYLKRIEMAEELYRQ